MANYYVTFISKYGHGSCAVSLSKDIETADDIKKLASLLESEFANHGDITVWDWKLLK